MHAVALFVLVDAEQSRRIWDQINRSEWDHFMQTENNGVA